MTAQSGKDRLAKHKDSRINLGLKEIRVWIPDKPKAKEEMQALAKDLRRRFKKKLPTD